MRRIIMLAALPLVLPWAACAPPPAVAGMPTALHVEQNPEVIWMVRPVRLERDGDSSDAPRTHYGLFACYRTPTPSAPQCHLAEIVGAKKHLVWPDNPEEYDMLDERN